MSLLAELFAAAIGTVAFSVLFFVPRKYYAFCGICGAAGWAVYAVLTGRGVSATESTFYATLAVIFLSRLFAVAERCPSTLFLIPGIFPLVPGAGVYWTSYHIVTNDLEMASQTGFAALKVAVAIVLGIIFVFEIPQGVFAVLAGKKREEGAGKKKS
ncbi:MAG: threonine/serine exporter family protein [Lachnospiraceae bacterium]|nr:threonine/serine exporter family protein [Lachnospiraceae bacterium]